MTSQRSFERWVSARLVRGITTGIENTNYFVDTDGEGYVLTVFEHLTFDQLPFTSSSFGASGAWRGER